MAIGLISRAFERRFEVGVLWRKLRRISWDSGTINFAEDHYCGASNSFVRNVAHNLILLGFPYRYAHRLWRHVATFGRLRPCLVSVAFFCDLGQFLPILEPYPWCNTGTYHQTAWRSACNVRTNGPLPL